MSKHAISVTLHRDNLTWLKGAHTVRSGVIITRNRKDQNGRNEHTGDVTFDPYRQGVRAAIVETFGCQASRSVQQTLYNIAEVVLSSYQEISDIALSLHERPYRPVDLFSAGVENPDDLFVAIEVPIGVIEVKVERET